MIFRVPIILVFTFLSTPIFASTCPIPESATDPGLTAKVVYNGKTKLYKYSYTISNGKRALIPVEQIEILMANAPQKMRAPEQWTSVFMPGLDPLTLDWTTVYVSEKNAHKHPFADLVTPDFAIKPGHSQSGFSFESPNPPGPAQFYASGSTQIPYVSPTPDDDEPEVQCPGWDPYAPRTQKLPTGMTIGPMEPGTIPVKIRLREKEGRYACGPWNPKKPYGQISVLVVSTRSFDASKIDVSSITFGPAEAIPVAHKLVPGGFGKPYDPRERTGWETFIEGKSTHHSKFKNLLLVFDLKSLDVQCGLDQAIFLHGKTTTGKKIFGGTKTNLIDCHPGHPDRHHPDIRHKNWERRHPGHKYKERPHRWDGE